MKSLEDKARQILKSLNISPRKKEVVMLENEIKRLVFAAVNQERQRCYEYAIYCRNEFEKYPALPQSASVASEVIAEGILTGIPPNYVEKISKGI